MTMFAIMTATFEFNPSKVNSVEDAFEKYDGSSDSRRVNICKTIKEAREVLSTIEVNTYVYSWKLAEAQVAYIEEGDFEWDEDLQEYELVDGVDGWDFKCKPFDKESL